MGYLAVPAGQMQGRKRRPAEAGRVFLTQQVAYCHKREPVRLSVTQHQCFAEEDSRYEGRDGNA